MISVGIFQLTRSNRLFSELINGINAEWARFIAGALIDAIIQ